MEFPSACWRLEYQRGPEDWFRYGERGLRQTEGKGERKKKARLETRKGQAIFIASDDFIPGCETSRRGQTLETMEFGGQAENPLVTPPALSPNPGQFRKPRLVAPTPGVEFRTFQTPHRAGVRRRPRKKKPARLASTRRRRRLRRDSRCATVRPSTATPATDMCFSTRHYRHRRPIREGAERLGVPPARQSRRRKDHHRSRSSQC